MSRTKTDPAILSARQRMRDNLKKATAQAHDRQALRAWEDLQWSRSRQSDRAKDSRTYSAVVYGISQLAGAVVKSMGVTAPINVMVESWTSAVTNFSTINIKVENKKYDINDFEQMRRMLSFVKGLVYHEAGHVLYSVPVVTLRNSVQEHRNQEVSMVDSAIHRAWNMLEDQRMETAMVRRSGILQNYFQVIVLDYVAASWKPGLIYTNPWPLVAGRTYLPKVFLTAWKNEALEACRAAQDESLVSEISATVRRYKKATTADEMWESVLEFAALIKRWANVTGNSMPTSAGSEHQQYRSDVKQNEEQVNRILQSSADTSDDGDDDDGKESAPSPSDDKQEQGQESSDTQADDGESDETSEEEGASESGDAESDDGDGLSTDKSPSKEDIRDHIEQVVKNMTSDNEVKDLLASINDEMRASMPHNVKTRPMNSLVSVGEQVCRGMIGAMETLMDHTEPAWRFRQEHGVLDPVAFTIHEPGDTDYWVNLDDEGRTGFDLAVSVLLDVSSSMAGTEDDLGVATYGIRRACDDLGVPCTVTTFSDSSELLWDAMEEVTPVIPVANGSTNPLGGLRVLDEQRYGKARHLVVILTDGVWSGEIDLGRWRGNGRYIVVAGMGNEYLLHHLNGRNPDYAVSIDGPMDLPREVTKALIPFIA